MLGWLIILALIALAVWYFFLRPEADTAGETDTGDTGAIAWVADAA